jgi:HSP20 family protein
MSTLTRRERGGDIASLFGRMDRLFDEWMRAMPMRQPFSGGFEWPDDELIRVDEFRDDKTQVVRAELAGIDPDKDVAITVSDGMLRINAQRRVQEKTEDKGYTRHELRYGSFSRSLPLPEGRRSPTSRPRTRTASWRSASRSPSHLPWPSPPRSPSRNPEHRPLSGRLPPPASRRGRHGNNAVQDPTDSAGGRTSRATDRR